MSRLSCLAILAAMGACAAAPDYFPLQTGNSWVYRITQLRSTTSGAINVGATESINGQQYYRMEFFGASLLVRQTADGSLVSLNRETNTEQMWLPLGASEKQNVVTNFDACSRTARVESRSAAVKGDMGEFNNALELRFTGICADAGATVQYFIPYIGLLRYESTSFTGPITYDLVYSRTGITNVDTTINAFTLALDRTTYKAGEQADALARLTLRTSQTVKLTFPSGQSGDLRITNEKGESVYTWSADKLFTMIFREEQAGPGDKSWTISFPIANLPPGKYQADAWLTTSPRQYSAAVSFEVVQ